MEGELYTFRYRNGMKGVMTSLILASNLDLAKRIGQVYCDRNLNHQFIGVEPAIIADESILRPQTREDVDANPDTTEYPIKPRVVHTSRAQEAVKQAQEQAKQEVDPEAEKRREEARLKNEAEMDEEHKQELLDAQKEAEEDAKARTNKVEKQEPVPVAKKK